MDESEGSILIETTSNPCVVMGTPDEKCAPLSVLLKMAPLKPT
jgi:hypothetical protein